MDEFLELFRQRFRGPPPEPTPEAAPPERGAPPQSLFTPRTLQDTLQAVSGGFETKSSLIPQLLGGASAQVANIPGMRRTVLLGPEGEAAQAAGTNSVLAHEVGHVVDFADKEAGQLRQELGLDKEQFAELFESAVLDPRIRGPVAPEKQRVIDFIDTRINQFVQRREAALTAPQSSTFVAPRR